MSPLIGLHIRNNAGPIKSNGSRLCLRRFCPRFISKFPQFTDRSLDIGLVAGDQLPNSSCLASELLDALIRDNDVDIWRKKLDRLLLHISALGLPRLRDLTFFGQAHTVTVSPGKTF